MVLAQVDGIIYDLTLARTVGAWQSEILARLDFPPLAGHRGYAARVDGSGWS